MDFSWTPEQDEIYNHTLSLVQNKLHMRGRHADQYWTRAQWQLCGDLKLLGLSTPTSYGGSGYDALTTARAIEAFGHGCQDMGLVFSAAAHLFACTMPIVEY